MAKLVPFRDELLLDRADGWFDAQVKGRENEMKKISPNDPETAIRYFQENPNIVNISGSNVLEKFKKYKSQETGNFRNAFLQKEPGVSNVNIGIRKENIQKFLRRAKAVGLVNKNMKLSYLSEQELKKAMSNLEQKEFNELLRQVGVNKNKFNSLNNSQKSSLKNGETDIRTRVSKFKTYIEKKKMNQVISNAAAAGKKREANKKAKQNANKKKGEKEAQEFENNQKAAINALKANENRIAKEEANEKKKMNQVISNAAAAGKKREAKQANIKKLNNKVTSLGNLSNNNKKRN